MKSRPLTGKLLFAITEDDRGAGLRWYVQNGGAHSIGYTSFPQAAAAALVSLQATADSMK